MKTAEELVTLAELARRAEEREGVQLKWVSFIRAIQADAIESERAKMRSLLERLFAAPEQFRKLVDGQSAESRSEILAEIDASIRKLKPAGTL